MSVPDTAVDPVSVTVTRVPLTEIVPANGSVEGVAVPFTVVRMFCVPVNAPVERTTTLALSSSTLAGVVVIVNGSAVPFAVVKFHVPARVATVMGVVSLSLPHAIKPSGSASRSSLRIVSPPPRVVRVARLADASGGKIVAVLMEDEPGDDALGVAYEADLRVDNLEKELGFRLGKQVAEVLSRRADLEPGLSQGHLEYELWSELVRADIPLKHVAAYGDRRSLLGRSRLRREGNCRIQQVHADVIRSLAGAVRHDDHRHATRRSEPNEGAVAAR